MYQNLPQSQMNPYYNPYANFMPNPQFQQRPATPPSIETQQPQSNANYLKGWPVTSLEQARAARIDLDGSPFLFTDYGHNRIYMKQINMDGTAALRTFALVEDTSNTQQDFVTRAQLQATLLEFRNSLLPQQITSGQPDKIIPQQQAIPESQQRTQVITKF